MKNRFLGDLGAFILGISLGTFIHILASTYGWATIISTGLIVGFVMIGIILTVENI